MNVAQTYHKPNPKGNLKLVIDKPAVRLGGSLPAEDMRPDKYLVTCEGAWLERRGQEYRAALQFRILDGKYHGVGLRMWLDKAADAGGFVSSSGKYARHCEVALGRPLREGDPVDEPGLIFSGRRFIVFVGYRKSQRAGGGGQNSDELAMVRKDERDYLRVHEILSRGICNEPDGAKFFGPLFFGSNNRKKYPDRMQLPCGWAWR
jgi:hypothetical protein